MLKQDTKAPVPGLEPGTRGLTVHCSNQLSYTGIEPKQIGNKVIIIIQYLKNILFYENKVNFFFCSIISLRYGLINIFFIFLFDKNSHKT